MANERISIYYDPQRQAYDTALWKTISGTPAINGTVLRFISASAVQYKDVFKGTIVLNLTVPTAPTAGNDRKFGLTQLSKGALAYFKVAGTAFTAESADGNGNTESTTITWDSAWTNTATEFKIVWTGFEATFYVGGVKLATHRTVAVSKEPMSVYVNNSTADNLDLKYAEIKDALGLV